MIKYIIQTSDLHIPVKKEHDKFREILDKFVVEVEKIVLEYGKEHVLLVICGDIVDSKNSTSNELALLLAHFFRGLDNIGCEIIIIAGNHDTNLANSLKINTLEPIFDMMKPKNIKYLDMDLGYQSGSYKCKAGNIVFHVYSVFSDYKTPDIELYKINNPDENLLHVGLFHGAIIGSTTSYNFILESGVPLDHFKSKDGVDGDCQLVLMGDIHLRSFFNIGKTILAYPSSLISLNFGERAGNDGHGFLLWDVSDKNNITHEVKAVPNDYGYYKFKITSYDDAVNNKEVFVNP